MSHTNKPRLPVLGGGFGGLGAVFYLRMELGYGGAVRTARTSRSD